jgi:circadian clock protein KaiC
MSSGIVELDRLLGGGIEAGSSTLVLGPAGTGKSLLAIVFIAAAIARGEKRRCSCSTRSSACCLRA